MTSYIKFKKLHPDAIIPKYQTEGASGFDIHCLEDIAILPHERCKIRTGLSAELHKGEEVQIRLRSGIAASTYLILGNGIGSIDEDYRGEWFIIIQNCGNVEYRFPAGARLAQGVLCPVYRGIIKEVEELSETDRGAEGLGSTGL